MHALEFILPFLPLLSQLLTLDLHVRLLRVRSINTQILKRRPFGFRDSRI